MALFERPTAKIARNDADEGDIVAELDEQITEKEIREYFDRVRVAVRLFQKDGLDQKNNIVEMKDEKRLIAYHPETKEPLLYKFDNCFDSSGIDGTEGVNVHEQIFEAVGVPLVNAVLAGYNACIICYGPSKTGKSELLYGNAENAGIVDLAVQEGFSFINNVTENISYTVKFSYWEMNNDSVVDLLDTNLHLDDHHSEKRVKRNPIRGAYITGLKEEVVEVWKDLETLISSGTQRSQELSVKRGTRWHSFLRLSLLREDEDHPEITLRSNLLFVNLKGADKVGRFVSQSYPHDVEGREMDKIRIKHGSSINKSLTALGNAINNVMDYTSRNPLSPEDANNNDILAKRKFTLQGIFGDSKTTAILGDAFCGDYCTVMIGSVCPTEFHYLETMDSLENLRIANHIPCRPNRGDERTKAKELFDKIIRLKQKMPQEPLITAPGAPLTEEQERMQQLQDEYGHMVQRTAYINPKTTCACQIKISPLWKHNDIKAHKHGSRSTFYIPKSNPADKGKEIYKGQWKLNEKSGFGLYENDKFKYEGDWKNNKRHGKLGTLWLKSTKTQDSTTPTDPDSKKKKQTVVELRRVYVGGWKNDKKHGQGVYYYTTGDIYDGEWSENKRHGKGVMYYVDGTKYDGEWQLDKQSGFGVTVDLKTGDRFEGQHVNGTRHGSGVYYYVNKGRMYKGEWFMGVAKSGEVSEIPKTHRVGDIAREAGLESIPKDSHPLPSIGLLNATAVVDQCAKENRIRMSHLEEETQSADQFGNMSGVEALSEQEDDESSENISEQEHELDSDQDERDD
ncbi:MORN repeat-containing protein [Acrasis kona]|uniref:MORN repeat-containing protein 3 n=1 Tax=Acrasis kona TaxID=1008807 RepID=A0AAW2ZDA2_9EUKA